MVQPLLPSVHAAVATGGGQAATTKTPTANVVSAPNPLVGATTPAPAPQPTSMTPTQWADLVLTDAGDPVNATTTSDILAWLPSEEPTSQWWGGYGTASDPTRINPLNAGDMVNGVPQQGYSATPLTLNTLGGGLGTYPNLADAAAATAQMFHTSFPGIQSALQNSEGGTQFGQALVKAGYAQSAYGGNAGIINAGAAAQAANGAAVTNPSAISNTPSQASTIADLLGGQLTQSELSQLATTQALEGQLALTPQEYQDQLQILQQNYGYSQQQFGVQQQQLNLQKTENTQQQSQLQAAYGFQQQQNVLSGQEIQSAIQNITQNYGFQQTQTTSGLAASGLTNSSEATQQRQQQAVQEQYSLLQESQAQQGLGISEAQQKEQLGYSQEQLQNGLTSLKQQQQSLGISEAQAQTQYNNAVQQLGLGNIMNGLQLEQQIAVMAGGGYSPISSMLGQLTNLLPQINGAFLSGSGTSSTSTSGG